MRLHSSRWIGYGRSTGKIGGVIFQHVQQSRILRQRLRIGLAVAALGLAFSVLADPADAHLIVRMTNDGLVLFPASSDDTQADDIGIRPRLGPDGPIGWQVDAGTNCSSFDLNPCLKNDDGSCDVSGGTFADCDRTDAGILLSTGRGADTVTLAGVGGERVSIDLGSSSDTLEAPFGDTEPPFDPRVVPTGHWFVTAGSGNDDIHGSAGSNTFDAGDGNDTLRGYPQEFGNFSGLRGRPARSGGDSIDGGDGDDTIDPGKGSDQVIGGEGDDYFKAGDESTIPGDFDSYNGGTGIDTIDYASRTTDIFFNSGSVQSGSVGANPDEQDRVSGTNNVILGSGNDTAFSLLENLSKRRYEGRGGDDVLNGLDSPDTLIGGDGADKMNGFKGNDTIDARSDGFADKLISCGDGTDSVQEDLKDPLPVDLDKCESFVRGNKSEPAFLRILGAERGGNGILRADLKCPKANGKRCEGRLSARGTNRHYSIAAGKTETVSLGAVGGRRVTLRANEEGDFGPETVSRRLKLS